MQALNPRPKSIRHWLTSAIATFILLSCSAALASQDLFAGELGEWLRSDVQPELTELLGKHPRFRGERVRVVAMHNGVPAVESNELTRAVRDQLTHSLTRVKGVALVWNEANVTCGVPKKTPYLLGVEVLREGRARYLVRIAMVDVEEGVWVSGAHMQWRGTLTPDERDAAGSKVVDAAAGTIDRPLPAHSREALVQRLAEGIQCTLKGGVEGDIYIAAADKSDPALVAAAALLRERLVRSALLSVAETADDADWNLELNRVTDIQDSIVATLASDAPGSDSGASAQRLAAVYVQRATSLDKVVTRDEPNRSLDSLIENLHQVVPRAGEHCYAASANCTEVQFDMPEPGYLLVLRTGDNGVLSLEQCGALKKTSGTKRFRLSAKSAQGFYALGTLRRSLALKIQAELKNASVNCRASRAVRSESRKAADGQWLARLSRLIESEPDQLDWQSYYFAPEKGRTFAQTDDSPKRSRRTSR